MAKKYRGKFRVRGYREAPAMVEQLADAYGVDLNGYNSLVSGHYDPNIELSEDDAQAVAGIHGDEEYLARRLGMGAPGTNTTYIGDREGWSRRDHPIDATFQEPEDVDMVIAANDKEKNPFYDQKGRYIAGLPINEEEDADAAQLDARNDKSMARRKARAHAIFKGWYKNDVYDPYEEEGENANRDYQNSAHSMGRVAPYEAWKDKEKTYDAQQEGKVFTAAHYGDLSDKFERMGGVVHLDKYGKPVLDIDATAAKGKDPWAILKQILPSAALEKGQLRALTAHMKNDDEKVEFAKSAHRLDTSDLSPGEYKELYNHLPGLVENRIFATNVADMKARNNGGKDVYVDENMPLKDKAIRFLGQVGLGLTSLADLPKDLLTLIGGEDVMPMLAHSALKDQGKIIDAFGNELGKKYLKAAKEIEAGGGSPDNPINKQLANKLREVVGEKRANEFMHREATRRNAAYEYINQKVGELTGKPAEAGKDEIGGKIATEGGSLVGLPLGATGKIASAAGKALAHLATAGGTAAGSVLAQEGIGGEEAPLTLRLLASLFGGVAGGGATSGAINKLAKLMGDAGVSPAKIKAAREAFKDGGIKGTTEQEMALKNLFPEGEGGLSSDQAIVNRFLENYINNPEWKSNLQDEDTLRLMNSLHDASKKNMTRENSALAAEIEKTLSPEEKIKLAAKYSPEEVAAIEKQGLGKEVPEDMFRDYFASHENDALENGGKATPRDIATSFEEAIQRAKTGREEGWNRDFGDIKDASFENVPVFDYISEARKEPLLMEDSELAALGKKGAKIGQENGEDLLSTLGDKITPEQYREYLAAKEKGANSLTGNQLQQLKRQIREKANRLYAGGKGQEGGIVGNINKRIEDWLAQEAANGNESAAKFTAALKNYSEASGNIDKLDEVAKLLRRGGDDYSALKDVDIEKALSNLSPEYAERVLSNLPADKQWALRGLLGKSISSKSFNDLKSVAPEELKAAFGERGAEKFADLMREAKAREGYSSQLSNPDRAFSQQQLGRMIVSSLDKDMPSTVTDKLYAALKPTLSEEQATKFDRVLANNAYIKNTYNKGKLRTALESGDAEKLAKQMTAPEDIKRIEQTLKEMNHPDVEGVIGKIKNIKMSQLWKDEIVSPNIYGKTEAGRGELHLSGAAESLRNSLPQMKELTDPKEYAAIEHFHKTLEKAGKIDDEIRVIADNAEKAENINTKYEAARVLIGWTRHFLTAPIRGAYRIWSKLSTPQAPETREVSIELINAISKQMETGAGAMGKIKKVLTSPTVIRGASAGNAALVRSRTD